MNLKLVAQIGEHEGREIAIDAPEFVIGRDPACQLQVNHADVSRQHCRIVHDGGRVWLEDLGPTLGTEIYGRAIRSVEVRDGDQFRVGVEQFMISMKTNGVASARHTENGTAHLPVPLLHPAEPTRQDRDRRSGSEFGGYGLAKLDLNEHHGSSLSTRDDAPSWDPAPAPEATPSADTPAEPESLEQLLSSEWSRLMFVEDAPQTTEMPCITSEDDDRKSLDELLNDELSRLTPEDEDSSAAPVSAADVSPSAAISAEPETLEHDSITGLLPAPPECAASSFLRRSDPPASGPAQARNVPAGTATAPLTTATLRRVRLLVLIGKAKGRFIDVNQPRFLIGRDPCCQIRAHSQWVSRVHASIEQRGGRVFVRDQGSTNGTILNNRTLKGEEAEVRDGDRVEIGPLQFAVVIPSGSAIGDPVRPDLWPGLQFTCTIQPGSLVRLSAESDVVPGPTPLRARRLRHTSPGSGAPPRGSSRAPQGKTEGGPALEQLLQHLLLTLGSGGSAPAAMAPPPRVPHPAAAIRNVVTPASLDAPTLLSAPPRAADAPDASRHALLEPDPATVPVPSTSRSSDPAPEDPAPESLSDSEILIEAILNEEPDDPSLTPTPEADLPAEDAPLIKPEPRPASPAQRPRDLELDFECPGCGTSGRASVSRLDHQLTCHVCGSTFHIGNLGEVTVDTRSRARRPGDRHRRPSPKPIKRRGTNRGALLVEGWEQLSRGKKIAGSVSLVVVLLLAGWFVTGPLLGSSPRARTLSVIDAVIKNQEKQLAAIAVPMNSSQAIQWMRLVGPVMKPLIERGARTEVRVVTQSGTIARTVVEVRLKTAPKATRVTLFWVKDPRSGWLLEGLGTLQNASALLPPDSRDPDGRPRVSVAIRKAVN